MFGEVLVFVIFPAFGALVTWQSGHNGIAAFMAFCAVASLTWMVIDPSGFQEIGRDSNASGECRREWDGRSNPVVCR